MEELEPIKTTTDIKEEANNFIQDISFRDPNKAYYSVKAPYNSWYININPNLKPDEIFKKLSFSEIEFESLPSDLKEGLEKDKQIFGNQPSNPNTKVYQNKSGNVFYLIKENSDNTYAWSRITTAEGGYKAQEISDKSEIKKVLSMFAFYEIAHSQAPATFPKPSLNIKPPIFIPGEIFKRRESIDQVIGTA